MRDANEVGQVNRRSFIKFCLIGFISIFHPLGDLFCFPLYLPLFSSQISNPGVNLKPLPSIGDTFVGEELHYNLGFWLFKNAARGRLTIQKAHVENRYVATFVGQTQGFIGFLTGNRKYTLVSTMEVIEDGKRFRTLRFEQHITSKKKNRVKIYTFDHKIGRIIVTSREKSGNWKREEINITPNQTCDDPITSFYNFRFGVYGKVTSGKSFKIPCIPKKGRSYISIHIASVQIGKDRQIQEKNPSGKEYFVTMILHKEFTLSKTGKVEGWLSKELIPITGKVKDVILLGDVYGTLVQRIIN
ncbi:MAG TPA: DUF3108 domain-containing protein [Syntrophaceae bacterium]|nr:DUF3108 domain-containing protein [Syntrophaceae bacterium]